MSPPTVLLATEPAMERFATVEGSPLEGRALLRRARSEEEFDAALPEPEAVLASPWSWCVPEFSEDRWAKAVRLRVIAGTFSSRFEGWIDVVDAARRGGTWSTRLAAMSPTVADSGWR